MVELQTARQKLEAARIERDTTDARLKSLQAELAAEKARTEPYQNSQDKLERVQRQRALEGEISTLKSRIRIHLNGQYNYWNAEVRKQEIVEALKQPGLKEDARQRLTKELRVIKIQGSVPRPGRYRAKSTSKSSGGRSTSQRSLSKTYGDSQGTYRAGSSQSRSINPPSLSGGTGSSSSMPLVTPQPKVQKEELTPEETGILPHRQENKQFVPGYGSKLRGEQYKAGALFVSTRFQRKMEKEVSKDELEQLNALIVPVGKSEEKTYRTPPRQTRTMTDFIFTKVSKDELEQFSGRSYLKTAGRIRTMARKTGNPKTISNAENIYKMGEIMAPAANLAVDIGKGYIGYKEKAKEVVPDEKLDKAGTFISDSVTVSLTNLRNEGIIKYRSSEKSNKVGSVANTVIKSSLTNLRNEGVFGYREKGVKSSSSRMVDAAVDISKGRRPSPSTNPPLFKGDVISPVEIIPPSSAQSRMVDAAVDVSQGRKPKTSPDYTLPTPVPFVNLSQKSSVRTASSIAKGEDFKLNLLKPSTEPLPEFRATGEVVGGFGTGAVKYARDYPGEIIAIGGAGYVITGAVIPSIKIGAGRALLAAAPHVPSYVWEGALLTGKATAFTAKVGAIGYGSYIVGKRVEAAPTYRAKGEVLGKTALQVGAVVLGGYAAKMPGSPFKAFDREAARTSYQIRTLQERQWFAAAKDVKIVEKGLWQKERPESELKEFDFGRVKGAKNVNKANRYIAKDKDAVIFGSGSRGLRNDNYLEAGTIRQTGKGLVGKPKLKSHDLDAATRFYKISKTQGDIYKITGTQADVKNVFNLKTHPFSDDFMNVRVKGGGWTKATSSSQERGQLFEGMTQLRPKGMTEFFYSEGVPVGTPSAYRLPKDLPNFIQSARGDYAYSLKQGWLNPSQASKIDSALIRLENWRAADIGAAFKVGTNNAPANVFVPNYAMPVISSSSSSGIAIVPGVIGGTSTTRTAPSQQNKVKIDVKKPDVSPLPKTSSSLYPSPSPSIFPQPSPSTKISPSYKRSPSRYLSPSFSPSKSFSPSFEPSPSITPSPSPSPSPSTRFSPSITPSPSPSITPSPSLFNYIQPPPVIISPLPTGGGGFLGKTKPLKVPRPFKYQPSLLGIDKNLKLPKGFKPSKLKLSGIEIRRLLK